MKKIIRTFLCIGMSLCVAMAMIGMGGCASSRKMAPLKEGRSAFMQQNYTEAFDKLSPWALKGEAQAQYAVGYMYFYGKGIKPDVMRARYWIRAAAVQGYRPAVEAYPLIEGQAIVNP